MSSDCNHCDQETTSGIRYCKDCGQEIESLSFEPEWHCYENTEKNQARCLPPQKRNSRNIERLVEKIAIPESIKAVAEQKYIQVVKNSTYRGNKRASIVAACIMFAYRDFGEFRTADDIRKLFTEISITKKNMSYGLTKYYSVFKEDCTKHVSAEDILKRLMITVGIHHEKYEYICSLIQKTRERSKVFRQASPQCVASAAVHFFLDTFTPRRMTKQSFSELVGLSDITISKLSKEISSVLK